jgi:hypothetical protein
MTEISATTQIAASPEQVWAVLADLASYPRWNPLFREASGQLSAGNKITLKSVHPVNGRTMTVKVSVLAAEPARELRWRSSLPGIISGEHSFTLTPADGGTRLVQTENFRGLLGHFSAKTTSRYQASTQALNDVIQQRAENGTAQPGPTL